MKIVFCSPGTLKVEKSKKIMIFFSQVKIAKIISLLLGLKNTYYHVGMYPLIIKWYSGIL